MWLPWGKRSLGRARSASSNFSCSSFKDVQILCKEDEEQQQQQQQQQQQNLLDQHQQSPHFRKPSIFHRIRVSPFIPQRSVSFPTEPDLHLQDHHPSLSVPPASEPPNAPCSVPIISFPDSETRIVVYFTSLRIVRRTFEDCRTVRLILKGLRVSVDERDLSMDAGFLKELQELFGTKKRNTKEKKKTKMMKNEEEENEEEEEELSLPRVFIGGRYVGGVEEIRQLHETGELQKFVQGFPKVEPGVCDQCGGYGFVLCVECNGSHKCYLEQNGIFRSCLVCNENGLIRCSSCTSVSL